jgi:hypothetical protein
MIVCTHKNVTERPRYAIDDPPGHYLCLDCGDTFSLIGDTDQWKPREYEVVDHSEADDYSCFLMGWPKKDEVPRDAEGQPDDGYEPPVRPPVKIRDGVRDTQSR